MRFKKSLISLLLAAAMLLSTSCSSETTLDDVQTDDSGTVTVTADTEEQSAETTTAESTTKETKPTEDTSASEETTVSTTSETTTTTTAPETTTTTTTAADTTTTTTVTTTAAATTTTTTVTTTTAAATTTTTSATTTEAPAANGSTVQINALSLPSNVETMINAMGAGWNLGNSMDAYSGSGASETAWGNPQTTKALIDTVKAAGFKTIRIPVSYMGKVDENNNYTVDQAWLDRLNEIVDYAINNGMYAIINIHHDGNNDFSKGAWLDCSAADQTKIREKFRRIWEQVAARFKNYGDHLIFESMNEIMQEGNYSTNVPADFYNNINTLNQIFVDTVRASGGNNSSRWLLIPGYNTNIDATVLSAFKLPSDSASGKLIVSVHYYDPYEFALNEGSQIFKWGNNASKGKKPSWGHEDYVEQQMQKLYNTFTSNGIPVIIGEYGAIDKTWSDPASTEYRRYYFEYVAKSAVNHGCVPVYWDNGYNGKNGFALFDRKNATVLYPDLVSAIIRGADRNSYAISIP